MVFAEQHRVGRKMIDTESAGNENCDCLMDGLDLSATSRCRPETHYLLWIAEHGSNYPNENDSAR